jgi:hypothetical protein
VGAWADFRTSSKERQKVRNTRIITLVLALAAVFAFGTVAVAAASPPELVNKEGKEVVKKKFTDKTTGESTFETKSGEKVKCKAGTSTGEVTGLKTQNVTNTFTSCSTLGGLAKCGSKGAKSGEIILKLTATLVFLNEKEAKVGVDLNLPENAVLECPSLLGTETLTVKGSTLCTTTTALSKTATIACKLSSTKGKQEFTEYEEGGKKVKDITETEGKGPKEFKFEESGLTNTDELTFEEEVKIIT